MFSHLFGKGTLSTSDKLNKTCYRRDVFMFLFEGKQIFD